MLDRQLDAAQLPFCRNNSIAVLAYSPLGQGLLTGKVSPDREFPEGDPRWGSPRFGYQNRKRVTKMLTGLQPIARDRGLTLGQIAVAWTVAQPGLTHALVGARNAAQAKENTKAGVVTLTENELREINDVIRQHSPGII